MRTNTRIIGLLVGVGLIGGTLPAYAELGRIGDQLFVSVGGNFGASLHRTGAGFIAGPEVSVVHYYGRSGWWLGGYGDLIRDAATSATRFSFGPEIGRAIFGLELAYLGQSRASQYSHGVAARFLVTIAFVGVYFRGGYLFNDPSENNVGEVGVLLKLPVKIK